MATATPVLGGYVAVLVRHLTELPQPTKRSGSHDADPIRVHTPVVDAPVLDTALDADISVTLDGADGWIDENSDVGLPRLFRTAVAADFGAASGKQYLALTVLVAMLVFEWGPGNETLIVSTVARVADAQRGAVGIPLVGLTGLGMVWVVQLITGSIALVGFAMFERTSLAAWTGVQRLRKGEAPVDWWKMKLTTRWALAFLVGASAVVLVQMFATGKTGLRRHWKVIAQGSVLAGFSTGVVSSLIAAGAYTARQFPATEPTADAVVRVASNPLLWIGLFVAATVIGALRSRLSSSEA